MTRKIIVVTSAYGNDRVAALGGQQMLLPTIAAAGADGVEIRRELFTPQALDALPQLGDQIAQLGLLACYSAPEPLFEPDGRLNSRLPALLQEAYRLNAMWMKLSLGHFSYQAALNPLRALVINGGVPLMVENDQTACGKLLPMQRFHTAVKALNLPVALAFDTGNWLWVDESPEEAARILASGIGYIHVKGAQPAHHRWHAVPPDSDPRCAALLKQLPQDIPRGIEFPLEGRDPIAVTRHYVNLLREE